MISLQTNVDSINAQRNLSIDNKLQSSTIQQLTSGYRINKSGDDAAGLAVANEYRSTIAQLTQGVANGNDGLAQLQIVDGGLNNISTILDRLQTLATQSASSTFAGDRATLNQEYQNDLGEITRQASNINLNSGGTLNTLLSVYIGGTTNISNAAVKVDLTGTANAVDSTSLGLSTSNVLGGGVGFNTGGAGVANSQRIDATGATFVVGSAGTNDQTFTFSVFSNGSTRTVAATIVASTGGTSEANVLTSLNGTLNPYGITAGVDGNGLIQFSGSNAFTVSDNSPTAGGTSLLTNETSAANTAENTSNYIVDGRATYTAGADTLQFQTTNGPATVALLSTDTLGAAIAKINAQTSSLGVYAVQNQAGTGISFQGANSFSITGSGTAAFTAAAGHTAVAPVTSSTNNATSAIASIAQAIKALGLVQGNIGSAENKLQYAIQLATSQIAGYSTSESQIRDADVAAAAANLSRSQVLTQTSVAALAQANSEPQAILKLLQ